VVVRVENGGTIDVGAVDGRTLIISRLVLMRRSCQLLVLLLRSVHRHRVQNIIAIFIYSGMLVV
jgi:hypothetical protein